MVSSDFVPFFLKNDLATATSVPYVDDFTLVAVAASDAMSDTPELFAEEEIARYNNVKKYSDTVCCSRVAVPNDYCNSDHDSDRLVENNVCGGIYFSSYSLIMAPSKDNAIDNITNYNGWPVYNGVNNTNIRFGCIHN